MSEYWISAPHFNHNGTMGNKSSTVHTPRNVELPTSAIIKNEDERGRHRRKKCVCLTLWLLGLILLCAGAIAVAHVLIPETSREATEVTGSSGLERLNSRQYNTVGQVMMCSESVPLEEKVTTSDFIVVATVLPEMQLEVNRVLKGPPMLEDAVGPLQLEESGKVCFEASPQRQIFFLTSAPDLTSSSSSKREGRSFDERAITLLLPKYKTLKATPKAAEIILKLVKFYNDHEEQDEQENVMMDSEDNENVDAIDEEENTKGKAVLKRSPPN